MATIDPRLFPLFETLVSAQADWLVFEIVEGVQAGVVDEEDESDLAAARRRSEREREERALDVLEDIHSQTTPLLGDAQIKWAARYVGGRLKEALMMLKVSIEHLSDLVGPAQDGSRVVVVPAFLDAERLTRCTPAQLGEAMSAAERLIAALDRWAREATGGEATP
ncbi:hypothetical protein PRJ39_14650 [Lysobacter enzymogenes]|uniref:hypothetical protein n=1 Tax=Lysobacter enzymogenes TaxID=69 RepID=UPI0037478964